MKMASGEEDVKLLFFDTFYHDQNIEELNIDLIQFSRPVVVNEVRVIPLKTQVETNLGKGFRLGGTLPAEFKLDIFINNLNKPSASTFEKFGRLDYKENTNIQFKPDKEVPTDGLILKGWYRIVTFAVYGRVTVANPHQDSPPPPPPLSSHPGIEKSEDDSHKQQHPLDYINAQIQKNKQSASAGQTVASPSLGRSGPIEEAFSEVLRKLSPHRERGRPSSRDTSSCPNSRDRSHERDGSSSWDRDRHGSHDHEHLSRDSSRDRDCPNNRERVCPSSHDRDYCSNDRGRPNSRGSFNSIGKDPDRSLSRDRDNFVNFDTTSRLDRSDSQEKEDSIQDQPVSQDKGFGDVSISNHSDIHSDRDISRDYFPPEPKEPYDAKSDVEYSDHDSDRSISQEKQKDMCTRSFKDKESFDSEKDQNDWNEDKLHSQSTERDVLQKENTNPPILLENERIDNKAAAAFTHREPRDHSDKIVDKEYFRDNSMREKDLDQDRKKHRDREDRDQTERERVLREIERKDREIKMKEKELEREHLREREKDRFKENDNDWDLDLDCDLERRGKDREYLRDIIKEKDQEHYLDKERHSRPKSRKSSPDQGSKSRKRSHSGQRSRSGSTHRSISPTSPKKMLPDQAENLLQTGELQHMSDDVDIEEEEDLDDALSDHSSQRVNLEDAEAQETEGYEDISSEDEMGDPIIQDLNMYVYEEESQEGTWASHSQCNHFDFFVTPLTFMNNPAMSSYQISLSVFEEPSEIPKEAQMLLDIIERFKDAEHLDQWVLAMEEIPVLLDKGLSYLWGHQKRSDVVSTLLTWTMEGCDPDIAMTQPDAAIKVRHLKIGIKMAGVMCTFDETIALSLLRHGVQSRLLNLLESKFIMFSFKHQALRALSSTTYFPVGILWFLGHHPEQSSNNSGYQRLVKSLLQPKIVKLTMSATAILRKIHFYESLTELYKIIERVLNTLPQIEEDMQDKDDDDEISVTIGVEDERKILANLEEITKVIISPHELIGQVPNAVPYNLLVDPKLSCPDVGQAIYNLTDSSCLLVSLLAILANPMVVSLPSIYLATQSLLLSLLNKPDGIIYLASNPDTTNGILRCLLHNVEDNEDTGEEMPSRLMGLELVFHLQALLYVDHLLTWHSTGSRMIDEAGILATLHGLHTLSFSTNGKDPLMGRRITAKVLSMDRNMDALIAFLEKTGDDLHDASLRKSVSVNYCMQILLMVIKTSTNANMLERYSPRLLAICQENSSTKLNQLQEWLIPTKSLTSFDLDGMAAMISQLKQYADDVKKVPPGLITILRIISSLIEHGADMSGGAEAKNQYVISELYSSDCFPIFISVLQKLCESQLKIWQQGVPYTSDQWIMQISLIQPTLFLIRTTLEQLIHAFGTECQTNKNANKEKPCVEGDEPLVMNPFKDLTAVPVLLELHTVMCSVPTSSLYNTDLVKIQQEIVETLLAFTQEEFHTTQTDEALNKSLWTLMLKELLRYTIKSPYTYMSGLLVVSELLPLPLPLHTKESLSPEESEATVVSRKLWSIHLQAATSELFVVMDTLSGTGCQPLQHLMRRVCWQIADLAAPSSLRITKILLDILMTNLKQKKPTQPMESEKKDGEEELTAVRTVSIHTAKTLNLLAYLMSHPGIKASLLQLIGTSIHSEVKYKDFLIIMLQLLNQSAETPAEIQAQEGIVSMLQSLCDIEASMVNTDMAVTLAEHLANSLPESVILADIIAGLLDHVGNSSQSYATIEPCLRILSVLTDHNYGFFHVTMNLDNNINIHNLLNRINNTFSKDNSGCLSTLSACLEFLRLLITIDSGEEEEVVTRTKVVSRDKLRHLLLWSPDRSHPLAELEELSRDEETLEALLENITALTSVLRNCTDSPPEGDTALEEIVLPVPALLTELFRQRLAYTVVDSEDERLSPNYWLANPALDEPDAEPEVLRCSLQALCEQHLVDFSLEDELQKEANANPEDIVKPKRPRDRRKSHEVINIYRGRPGRKPFVAPMRGRGIMNHSLSGRGNDLFRSRAPNTSRPPSMHVDDFVKMENNHNQQQQQSQSQQAPPPQQNRPPSAIHMGTPLRDTREKELNVRMRSGDRMGFPLPPGRFFTPPSSYRREPLHPDSRPLPSLSNHLPRGGSRGGHMPMERNRPNFMAPRQFTRGSDRMIPSHDRHSGRSSHFSPGGRGGRGGQWGRGRDFGEPGGRFAGGGFQGRRDLGRHMRSFTK